MRLHLNNFTRDPLQAAVSAHAIVRNDWRVGPVMLDAARVWYMRVRPDLLQTLNGGGVRDNEEFFIDLTLKEQEKEDEEEEEEEEDEEDEGEGSGVSSLMCLCGKTASIKKVKKDGANKDRLFICCSKSRTNQCNYFEWYDSTNLAHVQFKHFEDKAYQQKKGNGKRGQAPRVAVARPGIQVVVEHPDSNRRNMAIYDERTVAEMHRRAQEKERNKKKRDKSAKKRRQANDEDLKWRNWIPDGGLSMDARPVRVEASSSLPKKTLPSQRRKRKQRAGSVRECFRLNCDETRQSGKMFCTFHSTSTEKKKKKKKKQDKQKNLQRSYSSNSNSSNSNSSNSNSSNSGYKKHQKKRDDTERKRLGTTCSVKGLQTFRYLKKGTSDSRKPLSAALRTRPKDLSRQYGRRHVFPLWDGGNNDRINALTSALRALFERQALSQSNACEHLTVLALFDAGDDSMHPRISGPNHILASELRMHWKCYLGVNDAVVDTAVSALSDFIDDDAFVDYTAVLRSVVYKK